MSTLRIYQCLSTVWMTLIFILSSLPSLPGLPAIIDLDKLLHALAYGVLAYFFSRSLPGSETMSMKHALLAAMLAIAYGITDEYHQSFVPGREADIRDVLADSAGALIAVQIAYRRGRNAIALS
jgi:VanZ family protein